MTDSRRWSGDWCAVSSVGVRPIGRRLRCHGLQQIRGRGVALARGGFEPLPIDDGDAAAVIRDQAGLLKDSRDDGHGGTRGAEHHRGEFLRQRKLVGAHTVVRHQQPPRQTMLDLVHRIAGGRLHDDADKRLEEAGHQLVEGAPLDPSRGDRPVPSSDSRCRSRPGRWWPTTRSCRRASPSRQLRLPDRRSPLPPCCRS